MTETQAPPQLYLITPHHVDLSHFISVLPTVLDVAPVACLRLDLGTRDEDDLLRTADAIRAVTDARDIACIVSDHIQIAQRTGLDGVHLTDGPRLVRPARADLGTDAIVGAFCGDSRHNGLIAGESGADYVSFGPVGISALQDGSHTDLDVFEWWSEMVEVPVVAEGALDANLIHDLATRADFIALGDEIWSHQDPAARLAELYASFSALAH